MNLPGVGVGERVLSMTLTAASLNARLIPWLGALCMTVVPVPVAGEEPDIDSLRRECDDGFVPSCTAFARRLLAGSKERGEPRGEDEAIARELLQRGCELGDPTACDFLVPLLLAGRGGPKDSAGGVALLERRCKEGSAPACSLLGRLWESGEVVGHPDAAKSREWYERSCDLAPGEDCGRAAISWQKGLGSKVGASVARHLFERGCGADHIPSCVGLAMLLLSGESGDLDEARARGLLERACDRGSEVACGKLDELDKSPGKRVERDPEAACASGLSRWCVIAGLRLRGRGTSAGMKRARGLFEKGCSGGDAEGCRAAALMWKEGEGGTANLGKALSLAKRGCELGDGASCLTAALLAASAPGAQKNLPEARELFNSACNLGVADGCVEAGRMLLDGHGGPVDLAGARERLERGCKFAVAACTTSLSPEPENALPPPELKLVREWANPSCKSASRACTLLGDLLVSNDGETAEISRGLELLEAACRSGVAGTCLSAGKILAQSRRGGVNLTTAVELLSLGCAGGAQESCALAGEAALATGDTQRALKLLAQACPMGHQAAREPAKFDPRRTCLLLAVAQLGVGDSGEALKAAERSCSGNDDPTGCLLAAVIKSRTDPDAALKEAAIALESTTAWCRERKHCLSCLVLAEWYSLRDSPNLSQSWFDQGDLCLSKDCKAGDLLACKLRELWTSHSK